MGHKSMILAVKTAVLSHFGVGGDAKETAQLRKSNCTALRIGKTIIFSLIKTRFCLDEALLAWKLLQSLQRLPLPGTMTLITHQTTLRTSRGHSGVLNPNPVLTKVSLFGPFRVLPVNLYSQ